MGVVSSFLILSYYAVVAGWTLEYTIASACGVFNEKNDFTLFFDSFVSHPWKPVVYMAAFILMTHFVIVRGVKDGIEKFSKVMMPLLLLIICVLVVCSFSMPGSSEGLRFLLKPDFSKVTSKVVLDAMGQAFFSMSIGMGCLCTYASYFTKDANLFKTAGSVAIIDTIVAVMAGFIIFPAVFSVPGLSANAGPGLVFVTLPNVFQMAFHSVPWLGYLFALMFYILLVLAALTSTISLHEVSTAFLHEQFKFSRRKAANCMTAICIFLGIFCALSFGVLKDWTLMGMTIFDWFDFVTAKFILPLAGMFIAIFTGWYLDKRIVEEELTNNGKLRIPFFRIYIFLLKFVAPIGIGSIFINDLSNKWLGRTGKICFTFRRQTAESSFCFVGYWQVLP